MQTAGSQLHLNKPYRNGHLTCNGLRPWRKPRAAKGKWLPEAAWARGIADPLGHSRSSTFFLSKGRSGDTTEKVAKGGLLTLEVSPGLSGRARCP